MGSKEHRVLLHFILTLLLKRALWKYFWKTRKWAAGFRRITFREHKREKSFTDTGDIVYWIPALLDTRLRIGNTKIIIKLFAFRSNSLSHFILVEFTREAKGLSWLIFCDSTCGGRPLTRTTRISLGTENVVVRTDNQMICIKWDRVWQAFFERLCGS